MNLSQYEALIKAVETGTMTQAAEELGYTQSGLTRALNSLEEQWNVRLLNRGRSGVQLTPEGELLLPYIRTVLHDQRRLSEYIDEINGLREGLIRIGTFNSVSAQWLPGIIKNFIRITLVYDLNSFMEPMNRLTAGLPTVAWM